MEQTPKKKRREVWRLPIILIQLAMLLLWWYRSRPKQHEY